MNSEDILKEIQQFYKMMYSKTEDYGVNFDDYFRNVNILARIHEARFT